MFLVPRGLRWHGLGGGSMGPPSPRPSPPGRGRTRRLVLEVSTPLDSAPPSRASKPKRPDGQGAFAVTRGRRWLPPLLGEGAGVRADYTIKTSPARAAMPLKTARNRSSLLRPGIRTACPIFYGCPVWMPLYKVQPAPGRLPPGKIFLRLGTFFPVPVENSIRQASGSIQQASGSIRQPSGGIQQASGSLPDACRREKFAG